MSDKAVESGLSLAALTGASVVAQLPRYPPSYFGRGMPVDASDVKRIERPVGRRRPGYGGYRHAQGAARVTVKA